MRKKLFILLIIGCMIAVLYALISNDRILAIVQKHRDALEFVVEKHYTLSSVLFVIIFLLSAFFMLPVTVGLTLIGGYFFDTWLGLLYAMFSVVVGTMLSFLVVRYIAYNYMQVHYVHHVNFFNQQFRQHGMSYVLALQLLPVMPNAIITVIAALSSMSVVIFASATALGILPGTIVYVLIGEHLADISSVRDIFSWQLFVVLCLLALLAVLIPILFEKVLKYKRR